MIHKPKFYKSDKNNLVYHKKEFNDDFLHRKTWSISINAKNLEKCDVVRITLMHKNVDLWCMKDEIKTEGTVLTFKSAQFNNNESKYYMPLDKWKVLRGKKDWYKDYK